MKTLSGRHLNRQVVNNVRNHKQLKNCSNCKTKLTDKDTHLNYCRLCETAYDKINRRYRYRMQKAGDRYRHLIGHRLTEFSVIWLLFKKCQICGETNNVHFHHHEKTIFPDQVMLCVKHHAEVHHHQIHYERNLVWNAPTVIKQLSSMAKVLELPKFIKFTSVLIPNVRFGRLEQRWIKYYLAGNKTPSKYLRPIKGDDLETQCRKWVNNIIRYHDQNHRTGSECTRYNVASTLVPGTNVPKSKKRKKVKHEQTDIPIYPVTTTAFREHLHASQPLDHEARLHDQPDHV